MRCRGEIETSLVVSSRRRSVTSASWRSSLQGPGPRDGDLADGDPAAGRRPIRGWLARASVPAGLRAPRRLLRLADDERAALRSLRPAGLRQPLPSGHPTIRCGARGGRRRLRCRHQIHRTSAPTFDWRCGVRLACHLRRRTLERPAVSEKAGAPQRDSLSLLLVSRLRSALGFLATALAAWSLVAHEDPPYR